MCSPTRGPPTYLTALGPDLDPREAGFEDSGEAAGVLVASLSFWSAMMASQSGHRPVSRFVGRRRQMLHDDMSTPN